MRLRDTVVPVLDRCFRTGGILCYHGVVDGDVPSPEMHVGIATLRRQLEYVRRHYDVITLQELVDRWQRRRAVDRCVALTFDDAYAGVARLAAPLLSELDLPATIFVAVAAAERGSAFWWDDVAVVTQGAATRNSILTRNAGRFVGPVGDTGTAPRNELLRSMDFSALRQLARDERFSFGCHTVTHPVLPLLSECEQELELRDAQSRICDELPRVLPIVAYPFGLYDDATLAAAHRAGFAAGVSMQPRAMDRRDRMLALPRVGVSEDWSPAAIALRLNAGLGPVFRVRMGGRDPRVLRRPGPAVA